MKPAIAFLFALVILAAAPAYAAGESAPLPLEPKDWKRIRLVIRGQLDAFQRNDAKAAYFFAAPELRSQYPTPGDYLRMVRTGYKAVYRSRSVRFLDHFMVAGRPVQALEVVTGDEQLAVAYYVMQRQRDGSWKISRCSLHGTPAIPV